MFLLKTNRSLFTLHSPRIDSYDFSCKGFLMFGLAMLSFFLDFMICDEL